MLRCRDISEMATEFMESSLPWPRRAGMLFHLAYCSACRAYMDQMRKTRELLASGSLAPPSPTEEDQLITALGRTD